MIPVRDMTPAELAAHIATHLRARGIEVVLSGGACVMIHSEAAYVSYDLDFVDERFAGRSRIRAAMAEIGFEEENRYYRHPDAEYLVEFPGGPVAVGREPAVRIDELMLRTGRLRLLSPTDCVKDRLVAYFHWSDRQSLLQAALVAAAHVIELAEVERWASREGERDAYLGIRDRLVFRNGPNGT